MNVKAKLLAASFAALLAADSTCSAQGWPPWADPAFGNGSTYGGRRFRGEERQQWSEPRGSFFEEDEERPPRARDDVRSGGPRPRIAPAAPPVVAFAYNYAPNSIVIDTSGRRLYYVLPGNRAYEYAVSVGREGFNWTGTETVSRKQAWPDWYPPPEMRERDSSLPMKMTGGIRNPLGAMALYLGNTLYRIHGTNDVKSIGRAQSSGCFRMLNSAVLHLSTLADTGTSVSVVASLAEGQKVSRAPRLPGAGTIPQAGAAPQQEPADTGGGEREGRAGDPASDNGALRAGFRE